MGISKLISKGRFEEIDLKEYCKMDQEPSIYKEVEPSTDVAKYAGLTELA